MVRRERWYNATQGAWVSVSEEVQLEQGFSEFIEEEGVIPGREKL